MASAKPKYTLKQFTAANFGATRSAWNEQLRTHKKELLESEWERVLEATSSCIDYAKGDKFAYGVFEEGCDAAQAIVVLVYRKEGRKWLKLLELNLCPAVDLSFSTQEIDLQQLATIFSAAVIGTIRLTGTAHPTKVTKLYGRSGTLLAFLKGFGAYIERDAAVAGLQVTVEGRWLVFRYN